jgi:hypothetical protein
MCCGTGSHRSSWHWSHHHGSFCTCGGPSRFGSCFSTKGEKTAWLERYLEGLREEAKAVEERIAELKEEK